MVQKVKWGLEEIQDQAVWGYPDRKVAKVHLGVKATKASKETQEGRAYRGKQALQASQVSFLIFQASDG